ncbi:MAG: glycine--tRNA ligase subunit beta [Deltaproteobacteria bacterium]|nr:glycine--tRNA ligase subunit beta [Deltaproteobacteria bacterium]
MGKDLLLELGSEELPAGFIDTSLQALKEAVAGELRAHDITSGEVELYGTPRRLAVIIRAVNEQEPDKKEEHKGPSTKVAFDAEGNPSKALQGFAAGKGVKVSELKKVSNDKGEYMYAMTETKGRPTKDVLPEILKKATSGLNFPKAMRWGDHEVSYARPLHWIVALYGSDVVPFEFGHIKSSSESMGHRFNNNGNKTITIKDASHYLEALDSAGVTVDIATRRELIEKEIKAGAKGCGGELMEDEALLKEVANLVERPVVVVGGFDKEFLNMPKEITVCAMREHQRYFSIVTKDGELLPNFITVANTKAKDMDKVREGNERVLRARLSDANFYFEKDIKVALHERALELKGVTFQYKLGTSFEKVERFTELALFIANKTGVAEAEDKTFSIDEFLGEAKHLKGKEATRYDIGRASVLSKADLVSGVVGEFPKLQGIMGSDYAMREGESKDVARAIAEHYMPIQAGGELPATDLGAIVSIADKMDTIAGCFSVGLIPTGGADPYALRRRSLGIIAIILDKELSKLNMEELTEKAVSLVGEKRTEDEDKTKSAILEFFKERLKNQLLGRGLSFDSIDAVLHVHWYDLPDTVKRVSAIESFKTHPDCGALTAAFKRVSNILKGTEVSGELDASLFSEDEEKKLSEVALKLAPVIEEKFSKGEYEAALTELASIKESIDAFFDKVMVMTDDERVKNNRLRLLSEIRGLYSKIADLSRLTL